MPAEKPLPGLVAVVGGAAGGAAEAAAGGRLLGEEGAAPDAGSALDQLERGAGTDGGEPAPDGAFADPAHVRDLADLVGDLAALHHKVAPTVTEVSANSRIGGRDDPTRRTPAAAAP